MSQCEAGVNLRQLICACPKTSRLRVSYQRLILRLTLNKHFAISNYMYKRHIIKMLDVVPLLMFLVLLMLALSSSARAQDYPFDVDYYPFIKYDANRIIDVDNAIGYDVFFNRWLHLIKGGDQQVQILHLGDSHIQADFFTERVRYRMQSFFPGAEGARGIVFPYNLAQTNNPTNYTISSTSQWEVVNGLKTKAGQTGIIPLKIQSYDSLIDIRIEQKDAYINTEFSEIELWYYASDSVFFQSAYQHDVLIKRGFGRFSVYSPQLRKKEVLRFRKLEDSAVFELFAVWLKNSLPGITYHALGLNGARAKDFIKCHNFGRLASGINPELVVISLGTNDVYSTRPDVKGFKWYYDSLIGKIRGAFPESALLLITPGDHLIRGYLKNDALPEVSLIVKQIAKKYKCGVWDFYDVMGGAGSVDYWYMYGLSAKDRIHLSQKGYVLQGDLFFNALLQEFEKLMFD